MVNQAPRTRKDVSSSKKAEVIQQLHHFLVNGKLVCGAFTRTAEMLDIERRSVAYIWDTFCTRDTLTSNKCAKVGPKPKYSPDGVWNLVRDVPMDQRSTMRDISAATGLSMGTLSRHLKMGTFVRRSTRIKPLLTDANKAERTAFSSLWDVVHLDEKWFNADKDRRKVYLVPGETLPRRTWKSRRFIPKVMVLAAVSRPRFDHDRGV
ncbi:hypothetical protein AaE_015784 [Aphanomyces astaci]|uniref:Transposase Tc1-like domain-containing protein n=1 Tax=Aphanomyces astaci TaxID=112090 RepID=A0A6A4Z0R2_APHAT|nr:hypothetical protein AaE_015784 [Aphanomyces astaci]